MARILISLIAIIALGACSTMHHGNMVGNDRGKHGCIPSAGYTWSEVRHDCIRLWEDGIAMRNMIKRNSPTAAYVVFSRNQDKVEIFIPEKRNSIILKRWGNDWKKGNYTLRKSRGVWTLYKNNSLIYMQ